MKEKTSREAQAEKAIMGGKFEDVVALILDSILAPKMRIVRAKDNLLKEIIRDPEEKKTIVDFTKLPVKRICDQMQLEEYPDSDIYVLYLDKNSKWKILGIVNCKVSFHARETEACFWALATRLSSNIKYVMVTEDKDIYTKGKSELGESCESPRKARKLLEAFMDGIYLVKRYEDVSSSQLLKDIEKAKERYKKIEVGKVYDGADYIFDDPSIKGHTKYCKSVRPLDDLIVDLITWHWQATRGYSF